MLPETLRNALFDRFSTMPMRYVEAVPRSEAEGLVAAVYDQVVEDFFINGAITCQSSVPPLMAAMWCGGRETVQVCDRLDSELKEAMTAAISYHNDCPYCADMLVGMVHGEGNHDSAVKLREREEGAADLDELRDEIRWALSTVDPQVEWTGAPPFDEGELPEALGSVFTFGYVNRVSHVTMEDSPIKAPFGLNGVERAAVRVFGGELEPVAEKELEPGRGLALVEEAPMPDDLWWAEPNPRVAEALTRWVGAVERHAAPALSPATRKFVEAELQGWAGERMPLSRSWVEEPLADLDEGDRDVARLSLLTAKAPYQVGDSAVLPVLDSEGQRTLIKILAWSGMTATRHLTERAARRSCSDRGSPSADGAAPP